MVGLGGQGVPPVSCLPYGEHFPTLVVNYSGFLMYVCGF